MDELGCAPMDYLQKQVAEPLSMLSTACREQFPKALVSCLSRRKMAGKNPHNAFICLTGPENFGDLSPRAPQRNKEESKLVSLLSEPL